MTPAELDVELNELETRLERLRALYEQYFTGIEKIAPAVVRKDVDRRVWILRREKIRNTAKRFKLQTIIQRYNTYQQYWSRICREMENGTYRRHRLRAERRFGVVAPGGPAAAPPPMPEDFDEEIEPDDLEEFGECSAEPSDVAASQLPPSGVRAPQPPPLPPSGARAPSPPPLPLSSAGRSSPPAKTTAETRARRAAAGLEQDLARHLDGLDVDAALDSALDAAFGGNTPRRDPPKDVPRRDAAPLAPRQAPTPVPPDSGRPGSAPPRLKPPPPRRAAGALGSAPPPLPRRSAGPVPAPAREPSAAVTREPPAVPRAPVAAPAPESVRAAPIPDPGEAAPIRRGPAAPPPRAKPAQRPAPAEPSPAAPRAPALAPQAAKPPRAQPPEPKAPAAAATPGLSGQRIQDLHRELLAAQRNEREPSVVSEQALAKSIRLAEQKLREKHGDRPIDFNVVVKNGKAVIKPVVR